MHKAYRIAMSNSAVADIAAIHETISLSTEDAYIADVWMDSLLEHVDVLQSFPNSYSHYFKRPYRKVLHGNYLIIYRVNEAEQEVVVCRIVHGARLPGNIGSIE